MVVTIVTTIFYGLFAAALIHTLVSNGRYLRHQRTADAQDADGYADHDRDDHDHDRDADTLSRRRAQAVANIRAQQEAERHERREQITRAAAAVVSETVRCRYILAPALVACIVLAYVLGGPLPGTLITALCSLIGCVPLVANSWLNSVADDVLANSEVTSDEPLYVPADWR